MLPIHLDHYPWPMRPINLLSRDSRRLGVTSVHPVHSLFEARSEFPVTKDELKRVTRYMDVARVDPSSNLPAWRILTVSPIFAWTMLGISQGEGEGVYAQVGDGKSSVELPRSQQGVFGT
jgi:hypothetical protein